MKLQLLILVLAKIKTIIDKETTMPMFSENYSAPEVIKGNSITEKCDYYSLGAIFFEIFSCEMASSNDEMISAISRMALKESIKEVLCAMLQTNTNDRPNTLDDILDVFIDAIGKLNTSANEYSIFIDSDKLSSLKKRMVIEKSMNMTQFTNSFLKREFEEDMVIIVKNMINMSLRDVI